MRSHAYMLAYINIDEYSNFMEPVKDGDVPDHVKSEIADQKKAESKENTIKICVTSISQLSGQSGVGSLLSKMTSEKD